MNTCRLSGSASLLLAFFCSTAPAQSPHQKTWCNPLDIDYKYSLEEKKDGISYRSGADPVIVYHRGAYYLFVTNSSGWWRSDDLLHWEFVKPSMWPEEDMCAPAAISVRDTLYLFPSTFEPRPLYYTTSPQDGRLEYFNPLMPPLRGALGPWDPDIFHDEASGRWFMYFGSSNLFPVYGIELDHARGLVYVDSARPLLYLHPDEHGWERFGPDHRDTTHPYIEGAWMTYHGGKYYLQYAAPGTEYNVYANGTYVGDSPMGPFAYAPYNPVSYKPGGFMAGAGHGNTFQDKFGNYWNTGTPWVAVNFNFERRIAMFPAGFDAEGEMYSDTRFGDFPHFIPTQALKRRHELFAGWMLLSYRKPCIASSAIEGHPPSAVTDENPRTFWVAASASPGEWITLDLGSTQTVRAVQVNFADYRSGVYMRDSTVVTQFRIFHSPDGKRWDLIAGLGGERRDRPNAYIELKAPVRTRFIRYEHVHVAAANLAISDIRVFGSAGGRPPAPPGNFRVRRQADSRNATVSWKGSAGAVGYNVIWGIAPGKLYQTYQVFADHLDSLEVRALNAGQRYFFAMEAFNGSGVSGITPVVETRAH